MSAPYEGSAVVRGYLGGSQGHAGHPVQGDDAHLGGCQGCAGSHQQGGAQILGGSQGCAVPTRK